MINNNNKVQSTCQYGTVYLTDIHSLHGASGSEVLTFLALAIHAFNGQRIAYPTISTICTITSLSRSSVMRSLRNLKEKKIIKEVGVTQIGVVKYSLQGVPDVTPRTKIDTPPRAKIDTPPVPDVTPIKHNRKENTINIASSASYEKDVLLFVKLWNKWHNHKLCMWNSDNPLQEYKSIRAHTLYLWEQKSIKKDVYYEIQVLDIYMMKQEKNIGEEYTGPPRLWAGEKWKQGIQKWLSSPTPSHMGGGRKQFAPYCITVKTLEPKTPHTVYKDKTASKTRETDSSNVSSYQWAFERLEDALEAYEIHQQESSLKDALVWLKKDMIHSLSSSEYQKILSTSQFKKYSQYFGE